MDFKELKGFQQVTISSLAKLDDGGWKAMTQIQQEKTMLDLSTDKKMVYSESINEVPETAYLQTLTDVQTYLVKCEGDLFSTKEEWKTND